MDSEAETSKTLDRIVIVPDFRHVTKLYGMCIVNNYILLTTETKIPFFKEEFFDMFEKSGLDGVCVIVGASDLPFERAEKDRMKFRLTREGDTLTLATSSESFVMNRWKKIFGGPFSSVLELTGDLEEFNSYFCEGEVTNKLFLQGYRVYPEKVRRLDAVVDTLRDNLKGFVHVPLDEKCGVQFIRESCTRSLGYLYLFQIVEDHTTQPLCIRESMVRHSIHNFSVECILEQTLEYPIPKRYKEIKEEYLRSILGLELVRNVSFKNLASSFKTYESITGTIPFLPSNSVYSDKPLIYLVKGEEYSIACSLELLPIDSENKLKIEKEKFLVQDIRTEDAYVLYKLV